MTWSIRHQGSPRALAITPAQIAEGVRDGLWEPTDEVRGPHDADWRALEEHPRFAELVTELAAPPTRAQEDATRLDMNALIDVTLVLLIFFIVTTLQVALVHKLVPLPPLATNDTTGAKVYTNEQVRQSMLRLQVHGDATGVLAATLEGRPLQMPRCADGKIDRARLASLLRPYVLGQQTRSEMLLDAPDVSWGTRIAIQDAARAAGVRVIHQQYHAPG